jgi:hypothetical protein
VCTWYRDITKHATSESYVGCNMKTADECAALLKRCLADLDLSLTAQFRFTSYEMASVTYIQPSRKAAAVAPSPAPAPAVGAAGSKSGDKRGLEDKLSRRQKKRARGAQVVKPSPAGAGGGVEPGEAIGAAADTSGGRGARGGGGGDRALPLKALRGFCLFHLGGQLGLPGKGGSGDKLMTCFTPAGEACPNGSHEAPSSSVAKDIAADFQAALASGGPNVAFAPAVKKLFIGALRGQGAGAH